MPLSRTAVRRLTKPRASEIYLKAAQLVDCYKEEYSCVAICSFLDWDSNQDKYATQWAARTKYEELFEAQRYVLRFTKKTRVLALLFMHHIASDEERNFT